MSTGRWGKISSRWSRVVAGLVIGVVLSVALLAFAASAYAYNQEEIKFLYLINDYRQAHGLSALQLNDKLSSSSASYDLTMRNLPPGTVVFGGCDHHCDNLSLTDSQAMQARIINAGYGYNTWLRENIAGGQSTAEQVLSDWQNSTYHNETMLDSNLHAIGIDFLAAPGSGYGYYWTTDFGGVQEPNQPQPLRPGSTAVVTPTQGPARTTVTISGQSPDSSVNILWCTGATCSAWGSATVSGSSYSVDLQVPIDATTGAHGIQVIGNSGNWGSYTTSFVVPAGPAVDFYWTWYDDLYMRNWVLMANPAGATNDLSFGLSIAGTGRELESSALSGAGCPGGASCAAGQVPPGKTLTPRYASLIGGPVKATSATGQKAIVSQRSLMGNSLEEVLGTEAAKLSDHFYWTWYDESAGSGFKDWVLVANPNDFQVYYRIEVAGSLPADSTDGHPTGTIAAGQNVTPRFPGVIGGPLEVKACQSAFAPDGSCSAPANVMASQRVLSNGGSAFNEVPGVPAGELANDYLWTWYDDLGGSNWILVANPNAGDLYYQIEVGKDGCSASPPAGTACAKDNGTPIAAGGNVSPRLGVSDGPVEVKTFCDAAHTDTTLSCSQAIASQRTLWGPSFEEVPGYRAANLSSSYHWTWYDQSAAGVSNWVLMANPALATQDITVEVWIGGVKLHEDNNPGKPASWNLAPGENVTPRFGAYMGGPVEVRAYLASGVWPADARPAIASQRVLWNGYFNEVLGTVLS